MKRALLVATALLVTGCSSGVSKVTTFARQTAADCPPVLGQTADGQHDTDKPVGVGESSWESDDRVPASTGTTFGPYEIVAVVQVVSRARSLVTSDQLGDVARRSRAHTPPVNNTMKPDFAVLRPTRLAVFRQLKGQLPSCLDLDVPGGTAGGYLEATQRFPASFGPGDKLLGVFATRYAGGTVPAFATMLFKADANGNLTLPIGGYETINVNTWTVPPPGGPPPPPPEASGSGNPTPPPPCQPPNPANCGTRRGPAAKP